jgi:glycine/D-amino acid oxidase-like deaminating enzyme
MTKKQMHVAVVGAGSFGGWSALQLLRRGARVTLVDAWGPGNSRASSGGETRIIRGTYGPDQPYTQLAARSMKLWQANERRWKQRLLHRIGVLWMAARNDDAWEKGSLKALAEADIPYQRLSAGELRKKWPQINFEGIEWGVFEPQSGFLLARQACAQVVEGFIAEKGSFRQVTVASDGLDSEAWTSLVLSDGTTLRADRYVFACGPWLGSLFPKTIGRKIQSTKQEVFFFGTPAGDPRFDESSIPVWADHHGRFLYGIPGNQRRGFKIADDTRGPDFDPTNGERRISEEQLQHAREYIAFRFPGMKEAPLIEARVCQYEQTPDSHFIVDRHPEAANVWLVGGGSGHGFKHGPALGELVSKLVFEDGEPEDCWKLRRFRK